MALAALATASGICYGDKFLFRGIPSDSDDVLLKLNSGQLSNRETLDLASEPSFGCMIGKFPAEVYSHFANSRPLSRLPYSVTPSQETEELANLRRYAEYCESALNECCRSNKDEMIDIYTMGSLMLVSERNYSLLDDVTRKVGADLDGCGRAIMETIPEGRKLPEFSATTCC